MKISLPPLKFLLRVSYTTHSIQHRVQLCVLQGPYASIPDITVFDKTFPVDIKLAECTVRALLEGVCEKKASKCAFLIWDRVHTRAEFVADVDPAF